MSLRPLALIAIVFVSQIWQGKVVQGADPLSANATIASEYVFRGISQTDRRFALQGGVDWARGGLFAGTWASGVDFAAAEVDLYGGYAVSLAGIDTTASVRAYLYPESQDVPGSRFDYFELGGSLAYTIKSVSLASSLSYSPNFFEETGEAYYIAQSATYITRYDLSFSGLVGRQWVENNVKLSKPDYWHWAAIIAYKHAPFTVSATYSDTDVTSDGCLSGSTICAARAFGTIAVSF